MELSAVDVARASGAAEFARSIIALEVIAQQNRPGRIRRPGQKSLRAPHIEVVPDQEVVGPLLSTGSAVIFGLGKNTHDT